MYGSSNLAPVPAKRMSRHFVGRPTILYRGGNTVVTTSTFEVGGLRYPVVELAVVERVESGGMFQARRYELWALVRGQSVRLFRTRDVREFGQVCRALTRAREYAGLV